MIRERVIDFRAETQNPCTSTETQGSESQSRDACMHGRTTLSILLKPLESPFARSLVLPSISDLLCFTSKVTFAVGTSQTKLSGEITRTLTKPVSIYSQPSPQPRYLRALSLPTPCGPNSPLEFPF
jgi:hypothetical protein